MSQTTNSLERCHRCALRARTAPACPITGAGIIRHARAGYCPAGYFGTREKPDGFDAEPRVEPSPPAVVAVPRDQWPLMIRILAARAVEGEAGAGDTAKRLLHRTGADALAWLYEKATGRPCNCSDRRARLNRLYPY